MKVYLQHKGMTSLLKMPFGEWLFRITNYCNLRCEFCSVMANEPIRKASPFVHRRERRQISSEHVELFCKRFEGIDEGCLHHFGSAEPTMVSPEKMGELVEILYSYNRTNIRLSTNGYGLLSYSPDLLKKFNHICITSHNINLKHRDECGKYLKSFYEGTLWLSAQVIHYDLETARKRKKNGPHCSCFMTTPSFGCEDEPVIHPCHNSRNIMQFNNDTKMSDELARAGLTLTNPDVVETLANWRTTMPQYMKDQCANNCWFPWAEPDSENSYIKRKEAVDISIDKNVTVARTTLEDLEWTE